MFEEELFNLMIDEPPDIVGKYTGKSLIIAGSAKCLWEDMEPYQDSGWDVMAINDAGLHFPMNITHWTSLHPKRFSSYRQLNKIGWEGVERSENITFHACTEALGVDVLWKSPRLGDGSSGWNATVYGVLMGYAPIVLVGIPLDDTGHFYDPPWMPPKYQYSPTIDHYRQVWQWAEDNIFKGKVKSMSGLTREICGAPK